MLKKIVKEDIHRDPKEQLAELDKRLGKNKGAKKERKRLKDKLEAN